MMRILVPKETAAGEKRVPLVPERLAGLGAEVVVESGIGGAIHRGDVEYERAGACVIADRAAGLRDAHVVLRLRKPPLDEVALLGEGCIRISHLDPFNQRKLIERLAVANVDQAHTVFVLKRSMALGFAGVENRLFLNENTRMIFGDAKQTLQAIVTEFKATQVFRHWPSVVELLCATSHRVF